MTREELKQIGIAAGISEHAFGLASEEAWQQVERFAALVAKAEREACADVCDRIANLWPRSSLKEGWRKGYIDGGSACRNVIRERGEG